VQANTPITQKTINQHAKDYGYVVGACVAVKRCVGITTWGITDLYSWIPGVFPGQDYGLLWDANYKEKPAFKAVIKALTS
jgi:endo-1,4-beta-xylanase